MQAYVPACDKNSVQPMAAHRFSQTGITARSSEHQSNPQAEIYGCISSQTWRRCVSCPLLLLQQLGCLGLLLGLRTLLLPLGCSPGPSLPVQLSLLCHKKQKLLYLRPNQLLHVPQNSAQNPNK